MTRSRNWIITLNNPEHGVEDYASAFKASGATWFIGQLEKGEQGTVHLQAAIGYLNAVRFPTIKKIVPQAHIEASKCGGSAAAYCSKDDTRVGETHRFGSPPPKPEKKDAKARRREQTERLLEKGALKSLLDGDICSRDYKTYKVNIALVKAELQVVESRPKLDNYWYWGDPGTGKSSKVKELHPDVYEKAENKWWDGYVDQSAVLIDDLDSDVLGHYLKIWADHYPFNAEIKAGVVRIRPNKIYVTSNHSIDELFGHKPKMCAALKRRFTEVHFKNPYKYDQLRAEKILEN